MIARIGNIGVVTLALMLAACRSDAEVASTTPTAMTTPPTTTAPSTTAAPTTTAPPGTPGPFTLDDLAGTWLETEGVLNGAEAVLAFGPGDGFRFTNYGTLMSSPVARIATVKDGVVHLQTPSKCFAVEPVTVTAERIQLREVVTAGCGDPTGVGLTWILERIAPTMSPELVQRVAGTGQPPRGDTPTDFVGLWVNDGGGDGDVEVLEVVGDRTWTLWPEGVPAGEAETGTWSLVEAADPLQPGELHLDNPRLGVSCVFGGVEAVDLPGCGASRWMRLMGPLFE